MTAWPSGLGTGLQNLLPRFESGCRLKFNFQGEIENVPSTNNHLKREVAELRTLVRKTAAAQHGLRTVDIDLDENLRAVVKRPLRLPPLPDTGRKLRF